MEIIYEKLCVPLIKVNSNIYVFFSGILMSLSINIYTTLCLDEILFYDQWLKFLSALALIASSAICLLISVKVSNIQNYFTAKRVVDDNEKNEIIYDITKKHMVTWAYYYIFLLLSFLAGFILLSIM